VQAILTPEQQWAKVAADVKDPPAGSSAGRAAAPGAAGRP
jgi:hypothetical protein